MGVFWVIWSGYGFLVAVIVFGSSLVANLIFNATYGDRYYDNHKWPFAVSLIVSAVICWFLGRYLRTRTDRVVTDKATGQDLVINRSQHSLFFIPVDYWAPILLVIALVLFGVEFAGR
jgi:uncharacterized membrane protein